MRTTLHVTELVVQPGQSTRLDIDVLNTAAVIDGVDNIELRNFPGTFHLEHSITNLFPDDMDRLALQLDIPERCEAGVHNVDVVIRSRMGIDPPDIHRLRLRVEARVELAVALRPALVTGGRRARTCAVVTNQGNADISVSGVAFEPTRAVECTVRPNRMVIPRGQPFEFELELSGPRPWFGQPAQRTILFTAQVDDVIVDRRDISSRRRADALEPSPLTTPDVRDAIVGDTVVEALGTFNQKPRIPRGLITAATLAAIVALWSLIFIIVANQLNAGQVLSKKLATEFVNGGEDDIALRNIVASRQGIVIAQSNGEGIGRITVAAFRLAAQDRMVEVESVVTDVDGTFEFQSLLPGRYQLRASGTGFDPVWVPEQTWPNGRPLLVRTKTADGDWVLDEAREDGSIVTPERDADGSVAKAAIDRIRRDEFFLQTLPDADRPEPGKSNEASEAGLFDPTTIVLVGDPGTLTGVITLPPGAAETTLTVEAVRQDRDAGPDGFGRPTQVDDGGNAEPVPQDTGSDSGPTDQGTFEFEISNLVSPATYDVTVEGPDFETQRFEQHLDAGDSTVLNTVNMAARNATISGLVVDQDNAPLGEVTIVARAGDIEITVTTPTTGQVGRYRIIDLPTPETYTLTYTRPGYTEVTSSIDLQAGTDLPDQNVQLIGGTGTITGRTVDGGVPRGGIEVRVTGGDVDATTSTLTGGDVGTFELADLPVPETYTVTFIGDGIESEAVTVSLTGAGVRPVGDVEITASSATVAGTAVGSTGSGLGDLAVTLTDGVLPRTSATATAPAGRFSFADVAPGSYTLTFTGRNVGTWVQRVDVVAGRDLDLTVAVPIVADTANAR